MAATASTVRATGQYRRMQSESRAAGADPVELVTMLYDELEIAIGVLAAMVRQGQPISATEPAH
ncbi:MAG: flagellar protein FliS, partial [Sphingopyxis sp.]